MKNLCRYIAMILVSIILTNALLSNVVLAEEKKEDPFLSQTETDHTKIFTKDDIEKYGETGEVEGASDVKRAVNAVNQGTNMVEVGKKHPRSTDVQSEQGWFLGNVLASVIKIVPRLLQIVMSQCVGTSAAVAPDGSATANKQDDSQKELFTIQNLLMGKYDLFDINVFTTSSTVIADQQEASFNKVIKEAVGNWYSTIRTIAIMANLLVLLYTGIRMAMSTTVSDRVRYKKMLTSWAVGFALIFILHYIALLLITISEQFVKTLSSLAPTDQTPFEYAVLERIENAKASGWNAILQAVLYLMLVWYQAKFFFMYLKRVISNAFFILIAPLVTVTYAIDKSNDCKAQAFNSWLEEMITNIFIQPLHLLLFLVLLYSAGAIAALYPIIAILFLFGIGKAENLLRSLFKLRGSSISGIEEGTTFSGLLSKF